MAGFEAAAQQCENARERCSAGITPECLDRVGAASVAIPSAAGSQECAAQFDQYRACLREVIETCGATGAAVAPEPAQPATAPAAQAARGACPSDVEERLWDTVRESNDPVELTIFVETCPDSAFARIATAGSKPPTPPPRRLARPRRSRRRRSASARPAPPPPRPPPSPPRA